MLMKGALLLLVLTVSLSVFGQDMHVKATVTVPFDFVANDQAFPAGDYDIRTVEPFRMMLTNSKTGQSVFVTVVEERLNDVAQDTKMLFRHDGDRTVLHQIILQNDNHLHNLRHSKNVLELASN